MIVFSHQSFSTEYTRFQPLTLEFLFSQVERQLLRCPRKLGANVAPAAAIRGFSAAKIRILDFRD
jgi:hypothetical protein